jgi:hypothetical protein
MLVRIEPGALAGRRVDQLAANGGLTERQGARSRKAECDLAGVRSANAPPWKVCLVGWKHPVSKTVTRTALPWRFDASTFRVGAVVQRKHAGLSSRRSSDRHRPASPSRHRIKAVRRVLSPEAGGRYPVAVRGAMPALPPRAVRTQLSGRASRCQRDGRGARSRLLLFGVKVVTDIRVASTPSNRGVIH